VPYCDAELRFMQRLLRAMCLRERGITERSNEGLRSSQQDYFLITVGTVGAGTILIVDEPTMP
jgi:hypothetical protein